MDIPDLDVLFRVSCSDFGRHLSPGFVILMIHGVSMHIPNAYVFISCLFAIAGEWSIREAVSVMAERHNVYLPTVLTLRRGFWSFTSPRSIARGFGSRNTMDISNRSIRGWSVHNTDSESAGTHKPSQNTENEVPGPLYQGAHRQSPGPGQ